MILLFSKITTFNDLTYYSTEHCLSTVLSSTVIRQLQPLKAHVSQVRPSSQAVAQNPIHRAEFLVAEITINQNT